MPMPKLNRRALLKGLGGAAIALPVLDIMLDSHGSLADPSGTPKRYLVCFGGQSLGGDDDPLDNDYVPNTVGPNYDLKSALAPLASVKDEISVVSGLRIPTASDNGGMIPAGGRSDDFHINSLSPLWSGMRSDPQQTVMGVTSDQIVAAKIAGNTVNASLQFRVQAAWYLSVSAPYGRDIMSYKDGGQGQLPIPMPAQVSPKAAFDSLFFNFTPPTDPNAAKQQDFEWRQRKSVIDLVKSRAEVLVKKLGGADQRRIQQHLDEIRDLEKRVSAIPPAPMGACKQPMDPGMDPTLGGDQGTDGMGNNTYDTNLGYSGEEQRARVFCDLVHMAFTCDLTRVASLMFTMAQSHMNCYQLTQQPCDVHEIGHFGVPGTKQVTLEMSKMIAWHMKHFGYLVGKIRDTVEGSGKLIDNCAIVFVHEGGHGLDPSSGKQYSSHSTENMACLVAGRVGGLKPGQHVVAKGKHPANVLLTAMNAVGVQTNTLGEVSGTIPELLA